MAQETEVDLGGMIGLSLPTNEAANLYVPGWNAAGTLRVMPALWPVGLQADFGYADYNRDAANLSDRGLAIWTGALSVVYQVELDQTSFEPYFLGGLSINNLSVSDPRTIENFGSSTNLGIVLGGGIAFKSQKSRIAPLSTSDVRHLRVDFARVLTSLQCRLPDPAEGAPLAP